jgi:hypothetical protein
MKKWGRIMRLNSKNNNFCLNLIIVVFLTGFIFINQTDAQEIEGTQIATQEAPDTTRIIIATSGPAKFSSYWLDSPYRLVVEFKSRNVLGNIDKEVIVNQGLIKKITSTYFRGTPSRAVKTLTFELSKKTPYKIWQEGNTILVDIQTPLETNGFSISAEGKGKEPFVESESSKVIRRLKAMDTALKQTQAPLEGLDVQLTEKLLKDEAGEQIEHGRVIPAESVKARKNMMGIIFSLVRLVLVLILGFLFWLRYKANKSKNLIEKIRELKLQLQEKDKRLEQEEIIRKTVEKTALEKEKEYEQLQIQLQEKNKLIKREEVIRKEKEKVLQELEKKCEQLKESGETFKDVLIKRGIAKELTSPEGKQELWILGKSPERRDSPRLSLSKDFHNTVILKIELPGTSQQIKSFAENISSGGLCFQAQKELDNNQPINLRLFFYGGEVPNFKTQGWIIWKKTQDAKNYYGITFEGLSEKVKSELQHYIEANIPK